MLEIIVAALVVSNVAFWINQVELRKEVRRMRGKE